MTSADWFENQLGDQGGREASQPRPSQDYENRSRVYTLNLRFLLVRLYFREIRLNGSGHAVKLYPIIRT
jgi:hypothetical protein